MDVSRRTFIEQLLVCGGSIVLTGCKQVEGAVGGSDDTALQGSEAWQPAYVQLGEAALAERVTQAYAKLARCELCPRRCRVDRSSGQQGFCQATDSAVVASYQGHFGEELPLVGRHGSGTIFFSHCNLRCVFCQNWPIAHEGRGRPVSDERLAEMMLDLQRQGCHNINVVTPTHMMPHILAATRIAMGRGLRLPLCYNTSGYELVENIRLLDGIIDIYLPDLKFMDGKQSQQYSDAGAVDYPQQAQAAIAEMNRQVGDVVVDDAGVARRGLMIRHLVMPNRVAGTRAFVAWVAENLGPTTYVNIMSQYRVEHRAFEHPAIARAIRADEFLEAMDWAEEAGLRTLDQRSISQRDVFRRRSSLRP